MVDEARRHRRVRGDADAPAARRRPWAKAQRSSRLAAARANAAFARTPRPTRLGARHRVRCARRAPPARPLLRRRRHVPERLRDEGAAIARLPGERGRLRAAACPRCRGPSARRRAPPPTKSSRRPSSCVIGSELISRPAPSTLAARQGRPRRVQADPASLDISYFDAWDGYPRDAYVRQAGSTRRPVAHAGRSTSRRRPRCRRRP